MIEALQAEAILGRDAEEFLKTDLGRYIIERAEEEEKLAIHELTTVWPWRKRRIQQLQNQVWRAQNLKGWFADLIVSGRQAIQTLDADE